MFLLPKDIPEFYYINIAGLSYFLYNWRGKSIRGEMQSRKRWKRVNV